MTIDEKIVAKQNEIRKNHEWIVAHPLDYNPNDDDTAQEVNTEEVNEYMIHIKTEELLELEYELLLDTKYPESFQPNHLIAHERIKNLQDEIEKLKTK